MTFKVFSPQVYYSLGLIQNQFWHFSKSIRCFKKFLSLVETPEAHFQLGLALQESSLHVDACIHFSKAISMNPEQGEYYLKWAISYEA